MLNVDVMFDDEVIFDDVMVDDVICICVYFVGVFIFLMVNFFGEMFLSIISMFSLLCDFIL